MDPIVLIGLMCAICILMSAPRGEQTGLYQSPEGQEAADHPGMGGTAAPAEGAAE